MTGRVIAWVVLVGVVWGGYVAVSRWSNPWTAVASPVTSMLPVMPKCGEDCTK